MKTRTIKLTLEYDGSAYGGWQRQPHSPTVQGEVERAIRAFDPELEHVQVAGRTDSGVHAIGQVAHFHTQISLEARRIAPAINYHLPNDIVVHQAEDMHEGFNARYDSLWKRYRYRIYNGPQETALHRTTSWWIRAPLELEAMREAAGHFLGENDFNAFRSVHCDAEHAFREMFSVTIERTERPPVGHFIDIVFHANAFCRHMCRILAGTLAEVGMGKFVPDDIPAIMASRDRRRGGRTAPPGGLTLLEVAYPSQG